MRIVIKIGTSTLTHSTGRLNIRQTEELCRAMSDLKNAGHEVILVSSGAIGVGIGYLNLDARPETTREKQAIAAVGQVELMNAYARVFAEYGYKCGQILLTKDDLSDKLTRSNITNTIEALIEKKIVPIINENDSVSIEEFSIGDNDNLSAQTAILWSADLLILFSDIDGVYTDNPKTNPKAQIIETVRDMTELRKQITIGSTNSFGTGGIETKLQAAEKAAGFGIPTILANGGKSDIITRLADGSEKATLFLADEECLRRLLGNK